MALKIIKSGTARAQNIQQFRFSEDGGEPLSIAEPHGWPALEGIPAVAPAKEVVPADSGKQPVDLALLEKTAYENGYLQGEKAGMKIAEQKIEAVMRRYGESMLELGKLRSALYLQVEREVVKLAVEVAKKIVHREIQVDKDIIQTLVRVALSHVAEKSAVTVHLSPQDYNHLLALRGELSQSEGRDISLLADKSIERGGCLIQTECGDIDARIEEKFREVEQAFFEGLK
jgi:flagellar assembly protein FliH